MIDIIARALYEDTSQWFPWDDAPDKDKAPYLRTAEICVQAIFSAGYQLWKHPYAMDWDPNPSKDEK
jgi:hypothetical protein